MTTLETPVVVKHEWVDVPLAGQPWVVLVACAVCRKVRQRDNWDGPCSGKEEQS